MKITFFKNESHFYPRISYAYENAKNVDERVKNPVLIKKLLPLLRKILPHLFMALLLVYVYLFASRLAQNRWLVVAIFVLTLPLHELCHAIHGWLSGRKVERICFFPYKNDFMGKHPSAYVKLAFGASRKHQAILGGLFPLILLTGVPVILSIWLSAFRIWLLFFGSVEFEHICS